MATVPSEVEDIQRQMAAIRHELHEDVREVVATAEAVTDWQRYLRMYPWAGMAAAFVFGYMIVPKRHVPSNMATQADVAEVREAVKAAVPPAEPPTPRKRKGLLRMAWEIASPLAIRTAQGYAAQYLEAWLLQQQQPQPNMSAGVGPTAQGGAGETRPPWGVS